MFRLSLTLVFITFYTILSGQQYWRSAGVDARSLRQAPERPELPVVYDAYTLEETALRSVLQNVQQGYQKIESLPVISLPVPDRGVSDFYIYNAPVMEDALAAKYPAIRSYKVIHTSDRSVNGRLAMGPDGIWVSLNSLRGEIFVDPVQLGDGRKMYISYYTKDDRYNPYQGIDLCGVQDERQARNPYFNPMMRNSSTDEVIRREYRLAMACTGEWGMRRNTREKALSDMNIMVNRLNLIYERDMAIRFKLIADNDKLIFMDPETDPYTGSNMGRTILTQNTGILNNLIGIASYDVGHVLSVCFDIGGVAQLGSACQFNKGNGVTCHNDFNLNVIVTRVMAHEVGHQFDAAHSWNNCPTANDQYSSSTAYEPGSGSTIMSYAGTCGAQDNVANDNDDYFHVISLEQMYNKSLEGGNAFNCAEKISTGNRLPVITSMPSGGFVVPISTPLELNGSATDEDGDPLTYVWEQFDLGPQSTLGSPIGTAPLFRSIYPGNNPTRFLPKKEDIIANRYNDKNEVLPAISRPIKFRFTVRDNHPEGGGVVWDELSFSSTASAGPFRITYPIIDERFRIGDEITVRWNVANTDMPPVNCRNVNIFISLDGALENGDPKLIPLAMNVPNNGAARVVIPNVTSTRVRFVIKAADNIFLHASVLNSIIEAPVKPTIYMEITDGDFRDICLPQAAQFNISTLGLGGLDQPIQFRVEAGLPEGAVASFSNDSVNPGESTRLTINLDNVRGSRSALIFVRAIVPGVDTLDRTVRLEITGTDTGNIALYAPQNGTGGSTTLPTYRWERKPDADFYEVEVATNPSFSAAALTSRTNRTDTFLVSPTILAKSTIHYWRVRGVNKCGPGAWSEIYAFNTEALVCKTYESGDLSINISASGMPTVETTINVFDEGMCNDVNVRMVRGLHTRVSDLTAFVVAPSGKEVMLWSGQNCSGQNFNVGLDDQSPDFFQCPVNTGRVYRPQSPLSALNGENIKGGWKLRVEDRRSGEGGRLQEFRLELCSNIALDQPFIVRNDLLRLAPGDRASINDILLFVSDNNNTPQQLVFTLTSIPAHGYLELNGTELKVGDQFTQAQVNNGLLRYKNLDTNTTTDQFRFTVSDGEGGWVPITTFRIELDPSLPSASQDIAQIYDVRIFPNPAKDLLNIALRLPASESFDVDIINASGQICMSRQDFRSDTQLVIADFLPGVYMVRIRTIKGLLTFKFIKT